MGRLNYEPVIHHLSHPHPLHLTTLNQTLCAGCKLGASQWTYACAACCYVLHISCAQMPQLIRHPAHPAHPLALLPAPAYPEGSFSCDACARAGTGFSYHCAACGLDLHALCAALPLTADYSAHPHPLALTFAPPYDNVKGFSCDVCGGMGSNHWLYRCAACEFDAHLACATSQPNAARQNPVPATGSAGVGLGRVGSSGGVGMVRQAIHGLVDGAAQQIGQNLVQGLLSSGSSGGGGGGGGGGGAGEQSGGLGGLFSDTGSCLC